MNKFWFINSFYGRGNSGGGTASKYTLLFTSPTQKAEVAEGDELTITALSDAPAVTFQYLKPNGDWVEIGAATKVDGVWTYANWTPPEPFVALGGVGLLGQVNIRPRVLFDSFTDLDGTLLSAHTPDEAWDTVWTVHGGAWTINNNTLGINQANTNVYYATVETNSVDAVMRFKLRVIPSATTIYMFTFRYTDANNNICATFRIGGANVIFRMFQRVNGVSSDIISERQVGWTADRDFEMKVMGNKCWLFDGITEGTIGTTSILTGTRHGVARPGIAGGDYQFDDFLLMPCCQEPLTSEVSYTATKHGEFVMQKNTFGTLDQGGIAGIDIKRHNGQNIAIFAVNNGSLWHGLSYATADPNDPHNWTRYDGRILNAGSAGQFDTAIIDCTFEYINGEFYVIYSGRGTGKIGYAKGPDLLNLTKQGVILDLTAEGIYLRHPSLLIHNGTYYLYCDTRRDHPEGEIGEIYVFWGDSLETLSTHYEALSSPGYPFDLCDLTAPAVRYNTRNGYFEMAYSGYPGGGSPYIHEVGLAISQSPRGQFVRVSSEPLIPRGGSGSFDEIHTYDPCWLPDTDILYYTASDNSLPNYDGFTYATLTKP